MEGSRHGRPQRYSDMTVFSAFSPETHPSAAAGTGLNSDSASGRVYPLVATSYQERYVRLKPQDLTLRCRQQEPWARSIRHLFGGHRRFSSTLGEPTRPPGRWESPPVLLRGPVGPT